MAACIVYCVSWCCGSMSCVLCESYTVQNEPGYGCALCNAERENNAVNEQMRIITLDIKDLPRICQSTNSRNHTQHKILAKQKY